MKKMKFSIMYLAVIVAIGSAFAMKPPFQCEYAQQYRLQGTQYSPVGTFGQDYDCDVDITSTCTYYKPYPVTHPNLYWACRSGIYNDWTGRAKK